MYNIYNIFRILCHNWFSTKSCNILKPVTFVAKHEHFVTVFMIQFTLYFFRRPVMPLFFFSELCKCTRSCLRTSSRRNRLMQNHTRCGYLVCAANTCYFAVIGTVLLCLLNMLRYVSICHKVCADNITAEEVFRKSGG